ncbi:hypothetical protein PR202_ga07062 [Eleusine coracana subsp. coracana]|uniref:Uncharacterized protein n=1 Tax=Eleusine coracana subsp. coracana TaxID=191504 RepID=A0AAV5BYW7_ELECO|nr:hypothetical protein QOZ80_2AG0107900 [Eleusine coracana subsp. coracana]GJM90753.1 hypothetical protein PR202_ga07062 [Eleusine coracana subsp. coracana]
MAVLNLLASGGSDKENAPPSAARGIAVRKQSAMKRSKQAPRRRPPLRDITGLFLAASLPIPSAGPQGPEEEPAVVPDAAAALAEAARAVAGAPSNGVATKQGRVSLRKGFR